MKNHRFLWLRNRTSNNRKCEKARNIKEKRTIEMFSTASRPPVAHLSSPSANLLKIPETQGLGDFFFVRICLFLPLKAVKVWGYLEVFEVAELLSGY